MNNNLDKRIVDDKQPELVVVEGDKNTAYLERYVLIPSQGLSSGLRKVIEGEEEDG